MEEERKLSEVFKDICNQLENGAKIVESKTNDEIDRFMVKLENFDNLLISDKVSQLGTKKNFVVSDKFISDIEYIKSYLIMCEQMLDGRVPSLNPHNTARFEDLENKKIIISKIDKNNYGLCDVKNENLLIDEYYNIRYKVNNISSVNQQAFYDNRVDRSVNFNNSPIINSTIQINCNITNENVDDLLESIVVLLENEKNVTTELEGLKNELIELRKSKDKSKIKLVLSKIGSSTINIAIKQLAVKGIEFYNEHQAEINQTINSVSKGVTSFFNK